MPKRRRKVIKGAEEHQRAAISEGMLDEGKKNFEKVYGSKTPNSFNLNEDLAAMADVKMMTPEQAQQQAMAGAQPNPIPEIPVPQQSTVDFVPANQQVPAPMPAPQPQVQPQVQAQQPMPEQQEEQPAPQAPENNELKELWMAETNGEVPFNQWLESKSEEEELSDDPVKRAEQIAEFIGKNHPNAPTAQIIQGWKQMHGDIFLLNVADRIFIYRYLKRQEWIQINANPRLNELSETQIEEDMFNRCVLWPQMDMIQKAGMPAGGVGMVVQQIRLQSLFLDPGYVAQLTIKI